MSEHPPPAPDWILGEDGHWKPPPFQVGGRPPAPPPSAAPGTAPTPPAGGWTPPPGGAPPWGPPPVPGPSTGPSTGRIVAWVVGGFAVAGVAVVGILATAVVFLGTTAEPRFTPVGSSLPDDGDGASTPIGGEDEALDAPSEPTMTESMETVDFVDDALSDAWISTGGEDLPVEFDVAGACAPDGWLDGATDRYRTYWDRPGGPVTDALTLSLTAYADDAAAAADLARARTPEYRACEVTQVRAEVTGATDATVQPIADDPRAPGATHQIDVVGVERPTEYDFTVVVGHLRAHLDFCGCADLDLEAQRQVARDVAVALADAQGLPAPG